MKLDEREIEKVLSSLGRLKTAVIDSSSIIYIQKAGFLPNLAAAVELLTIPQVIRETGLANLPVRVVEPPGESREVETDRLLFATATGLDRALISEDRAILLKCRATGVEYYNAYNMLILLRLKDLIGEEQFSGFEDKLLSVAHYGRFVIDYIWYVKQYLEKLL